jgi:hypothetical protein
MQTLVHVALGGGLKSVRVTRTFTKAANKCGVSIDSFESLEVMWLRVLGKVINRATDEPSNNGLVVLADLTEACWIMSEFLVFYT